MNRSPANRTALLAAHKVCKAYGAHEVLHEVSLSIAEGEIVSIIGPNGAGKTTLLRCLLGLETPTHGEVVRAAKLKIGYVPQHFSAHPAMPITVRAFLEIYGTLDTALADQLEVAKLLSRQMSDLSGGESRRVLLLRALLHKPQVLMLDEPASGVDINGQVQLYALLNELAVALQLAIVVVSHDLHVVMASTHRVICLNHHICCEGTPQQVGAEPAFRALFGDTLASQLALYHHHHTHTHGLGDEEYPHTHHHHHAGCNHD